jgi:hypothetical protein
VRVAELNNFSTGPSVKMFTVKPGKIEIRPKNAIFKVLREWPLSGGKIFFKNSGGAIVLVFERTRG